MSEATPVRFELRTLKNGVPAGGGRVPVLLRMEASEVEEDRPRSAIDLALVIDRSGSMTGAPFEAAKRAAHDAVDLLEDDDRLAVVAFGSEIEVVLPATPVARRGPLHDRIDALAIEGMTALHAGWVEGAQQLVERLDPARNARVVLLTDGQANEGRTDPGSIAADVGRMHAHGIVTSAIGLGSGFHEDLLQAMADAGGGRFGYAEDASRLEGVMAAELIGIDATVARQVRLAPLPGGRAQLIELLNDLPADEETLMAPDLVAGVPVDLVGLIEVPPAAGDDATRLLEAAVAWTDAEGGRHEERLTLDRPVMADDAYDEAAADPDVAAAYAALRAVRMRREAMERIDRGDRDGVRRSVSAIEALLRGAPRTKAIERELRQLPLLQHELREGSYAKARKRMALHRERGRKGFDDDAFVEGAMHAARMTKMAARRSERGGSQPASGGHGSRVPAPPHLAGSGLADAFDVPRSDGSTGSLRLLLGDLTDRHVDAIVNPTNPRLFGTGATVDGAVHRRGGMGLTRACREIGHVDVGDAVVTKGFDLPAAYVLHTAVPVYERRRKDEEALASCYRSAFRLAREMRLTSLAFPAIGAGTNGFPLGEAARVALEEILDALAQPGGPAQVEVVLYDRHAYQRYVKLLASLTSARRFGAGAA